MTKALAEIQVIPIGVGVSVRKEVQRAHEIIRASGLKVQLHSYGTNVEGDLDTILSTIKRIHETLHAAKDRVKLACFTSLEANWESGHVVIRIRGWTTVSGMQIEMAVARPLHDKEVAMPVKITEEVRCCGDDATGYVKACSELYRSISLVEATDRDDPVFEWVDESKPVGPSFFGRHERLPIYTIFRPKGLLLAGAFDDAEECAVCHQNYDPHVDANDGTRQGGYSRDCPLDSDYRARSSGHSLLLSLNHRGHEDEHKEHRPEREFL